MSRQRLLYLISLLLSAAAALVHTTISQPASADIQRLTAERARLESEISQATAQLRELEGTAPPRLPPLSRLQERVSQVASMLPATPGYSVVTGTPQAFPSGEGPLATRVPLTASTQTTYDGAVSLLADLSGLPYAVLEEVALSRVPSRPGLVHVRAVVSLVFEQTPGGGTR
ncbi:MAG: hypothetical protein QN120_10930 [Armatimonadota bacterium]|nr:hypothetical protein [Armatimonadota bacterium]MDR7613140.1 hypothetical protein [Armatimonadota bacterium]